MARTIVVFVSDHGHSFSELDHIDKTTGFDQDIRAPPVIAVPFLAATHGQVVTRPVAQVDLYPTLMELLSIDQSGPLDGTSLVPQLKDRQAAHGPVFFTTSEDFGFNLTRWVVKEDTATGEVWKLGVWENDDNIPAISQLYNLTRDPGEYVNLRSRPSSRARVTELRRELARVGLLGPSWRNFSKGVSGHLGVPDLTWTGLPALGNPGSLPVGSSSGTATLGLLSIGLSGTDLASHGLGVRQHFMSPIGIPADGLTLILGLPTKKLFHEMPIGLQVQQVGPQAPDSITVSRALGLLLSL